MTQIFAEPQDVAEVRQRVITGLPLEVRAVELRGDRLHFAIAGPVDRIVPNAATLESFLTLAPPRDREATTSEQKVLGRKLHRFAARWGNLELCSHGCPPNLCAAEPRCREPWYGRSNRRLVHIASPKHWRLWARRFAALGDLSQRVGEDWDQKTVAAAFDWWQPADLDVLAPPPEPAGAATDRRPEAPTALMQRTALVGALNALLGASGVRYELVITRGNGWAITDGARNLFGVLVAQLVQQCVNVSTWKVCRRCRRGFKADRRTALYCPKCRTAGVPQRVAQQAVRDRRRSKGLTSRGTPRLRSR